ncbi:MAG: helix-turn-helix domain-containing protein [Chloroflexota bacterium]
MNRKEFGKLIASLRREMGWTQGQLARVAEIEEPIISQIERGVKAHFEPEQLVSLADAFQMITLERREFFLAASGVEPSKIARPNLPQVASDTHDPDKELEKIARLMEQIRVPAFVRDPYSDAVMVNNSAMILFGMDPSNVGLSMSMSGLGADAPESFNIIHFLFVRSQPLRRQIHRAQDWDPYVVNAMRAFRVYSLRYRGKPYFEYLMRIFRNPSVYPAFERYWKLAYSVERDSEANTYVVSYHDRNLGELTFMSLTTQFITAFGELYLTQSQPLNENAERAFSELARRGGYAVHRFAPWPEKRFPGS